jgi:hypothetical protein
MLTRLKQYFWIGLFIACFFYLLSHHFIFYSLKSFDTLDKAKLTFRYTFYSLAMNKPEQALKIDVLRKAGIGDLMVERGLISKEQLDNMLSRIDKSQ